MILHPIQTVCYGPRMSRSNVINCEVSRSNVNDNETYCSVASLFLYACMLDPNVMFLTVNVKVKFQ